MSNNTKTMVGALGAAFRGVKEDLKDLDGGDGVIAKVAGPFGMGALGLAVDAGGAVSLGVAAGSAPAVIAALLPALTIVGVGAGIGIVLVAGKGVVDYVDELEASKKRKG